MIELWTLALLGGLIVGFFLGGTVGTILVRRNACWVIEKGLVQYHGGHRHQIRRLARILCGGILHCPPSAYEFTSPELQKSA